MKSFFSLSFIIFILITIKSCKKDDIEVTTELNEKNYNSTNTTIEFKIKLSTDFPEYLKFIHINATPFKNKALLYLSLNDENPGPTQFDISAANEGINQIYVPRTYFMTEQNNSFYMNSVCDGYCDFNISFKLVDKMYAEKSVRLDYLTFDNKEYLIYFNGNETDKNSRLMVTAAGGGKSQHGTKNNVEFTLTYIPDNGSNATIEVNSNIMFNGAGATFSEEEYQKLGKGHYLARVKAPINTYISFMVRQINVVSDLFIDGKAIYGFLQGEDIDKFDKFELKNIKKDNSETGNRDRTFQVSILAKGELNILKSPYPFCDKEATGDYIVKDESQILLTFSSVELSKNIKYLCILGRNKVNAYILEVHDVTEQKMATIVTEPLVNGYIYEDRLKKFEVRSYRHSKYKSKALTNYNCKVTQGKATVAAVKCSSFPKCYLTKEIIEGKSSEQSIESELLPSIDNFYTDIINIDIEKNAYGPVKYLLAVVCQTEECTYKVYFTDEEDSLSIKEDNRIINYISKGYTNYYHFKISESEQAKKVFIYLRTISGDTSIDVLEDAMEKKRYYMENTKILEFYDYEYTGLYTLKITGNIGSFYILTYEILTKNEEEENKIHDIGLGISLVSGIKNGHKHRKFRMSIDKTKGNILRYLTTFHPINCDINVTYKGLEEEEEEVNSFNRIFQHEINITTSTYKKDYLEYEVNDLSPNNESSYENKFCLFQVMAQEVSNITESIISEGTNIGFVLTSKTNEIGFVYPHSAGESDILIKYNLENNYLVEMIIKINSKEKEKMFLSRSSSYIISDTILNAYCPDNNQVCGINIHFKANITSENIYIPMSFMIKSNDITPSSLVKNKLLIDLVTPNTIQYYMVDIGPEDAGEIVLNFKKGSGIMFAKIVGKEADPEEGSNWNNRVRLPTQDEKEESVSEFDPYKNNIKYNATKLYKYGNPVCSNGCELYIGVESTDKMNSSNSSITNSSKELKDYLEYSIYIRPIINMTSSDSNERQKLINKVMVDILANEFVTGYIESPSDNHYYIFDVLDDCDSIEIEFQSESCTLYINSGDEFPEPEKKSQWTLNSKIISMIQTISKNELKLDTLKGAVFRIAVNTTKYDELMSMMYIFRIRMVKSSKMNVIEINGNLATVCEIKDINNYCDLIYPISDYEFNKQSSLFVYAEAEILSDIDIFFNPIISYVFDNLTKEEMEKRLPGENPRVAKKSTKTEGIKSSYLEITPSDLIIEENIKSYALISIKSYRIGAINIYTTMRQKVTNTSLNPYSKLLFHRKKNEKIFFETKGDQAYNFHIRCINGDGYAYFESDQYNMKQISVRSMISIPLPKKKKKDTLIIEPNGNLTFYIYENIYPEVRSMELIEFGISGSIVYNKDNKPDFPLIYYMKIRDENDSININIHINDLMTDFKPKDDGNYTDIFDVTGYIVDENMIKSMMRSKRKNPSKKGAIIGRYDKSLKMAKLYFNYSQIQSRQDIENKYLVINLNKNQYMESEILSMGVSVSAMPFRNNLYQSPHNIYIAGNLLKEEPTHKCNEYKLGLGNKDDKYIQLEIGIISSNVYFKIEDKNNISFTEEREFKYGKYILLLTVQNNNDLILYFCKNTTEIALEVSLNYIFKIKSSKDNNFINYILPDDTVTYTPIFTESKNSLNLTIPKILFKGRNTSVPAIYSIRLYANSTLVPKDNLTTISFISHYAYATYIYKVIGNDNDTNSSNYIINNFPKDQSYIVSILAITDTEEKKEIFAFKQIENPFGKQPIVEEKKKNSLFIILFAVGIPVIAISSAIAIYFFIRMLKKKKQLDDELSKIVSIETNDERFENNNDILL